jgi:hypothetical protein
MLRNDNYFRKLSKQANDKIETIQEAMIADKPDDKKSYSSG